MANESFKVFVAYAASPREQLVLEMKVSPHTTIRGAVEQSGILDRYPHLSLEAIKVGIFGELKTLSDRLKPLDRIEIYRPLQVDPKDARRMRSVR
jgi:putative ubiquitin-RnfH superfamily antitoxin RatB of RatAB toxin-antitoxin module